ncbi:Hypothetical protein A7982_03071 [Minicystis rosea]|nr:Hypothetical protein A7982_03071 [Minicystis rosea]
MERAERKRRAPAAAEAGAFVAEVADIDETGRLQVRRSIGAPSLAGPSVLVACRVAVPGYAPRVGDRVVALAVGEGDACVIGVLDAPARIASASGASASIDGGALVLRDPRGELVASYDPEAGALRIGAVAALTIAVPEGKLSLDADEIELRARSRAAITAPDLDVTARRADLHAEEASLAATAVRVVAEEAAHAVGRWEVRVERLLERAAEAYREAELAETRADRVRTLAKAAFEVVTGRASILSDDDAVIDGKRVLLG